MVSILCRKRRGCPAKRSRRRAEASKKEEAKIKAAREGARCTSAERNKPNRRPPPPLPWSMHANQPTNQKKKTISRSTAHSPKKTWSGYASPSNGDPRVKHPEPIHGAFPAPPSADGDPVATPRGQASRLQCPLPTRWAGKRIQWQWRARKIFPGLSRPGSYRPTTTTSRSSQPFDLTWSYPIFPRAVSCPRDFGFVALSGYLWFSFFRGPVFMRIWLWRESEYH